MYSLVEQLAFYNFTGNSTRIIPGKSKYSLDIGLTATNAESYIFYDLVLTVFTNSNGVPQHSLELTFVESDTFGQSPSYVGASTPCFRGVLRTDNTVKVAFDTLDSTNLSTLVTEGIQKEELLSAYCLSLDSIIDYLTYIVNRRNHS